MRYLLIALSLCFATVTMADNKLYSPDGTYLGVLGGNKYNPDSTSNPYGQYGSKYSPKSINNPYGQYGSEYSNKSPNNPYATQAPKVYNSNR
jgi:hypothetical protein